MATSVEIRISTGATLRGQPEEIPFNAIFVDVSTSCTSKPFDQQADWVTPFRHSINDSYLQEMKEHTSIRPPLFASHSTLTIG